MASRVQQTHMGRYVCSPWRHSHKVQDTCRWLPYRVHADQLARATRRLEFNPPDTTIGQRTVRKVLIGYIIAFMEKKIVRQGFSEHPTGTFGHPLPRFDAGCQSTCCLPNCSSALDAGAKWTRVLKVMPSLPEAEFTPRPHKFRSYLNFENLIPRSLSVEAYMVGAGVQNHAFRWRRTKES